jgi:hypothetical protein
MTPRSLRLDVTLHDLQLAELGFAIQGLIHCVCRDEIKDFDVIQG